MLTFVGISGFALLVLVYANAGRKLPFGVLSLPCVMALTSIIYFYLMPLIALANDQNNFFGLELNLEPVHAAALFYTIGAALAFRVFWVYLRSDPSEERGNDRRLNSAMLWGFLALAIVGMSAQVILGGFNLFHKEDYIFDVSVTGHLLFLNLSYSLMIPMTLVILIRKNFNFWSLLLLVMVLVVFLAIGFRFRIVILLCAAVSSFCLIRKIKLGFFRTALGIILMLSSINLIGFTRSYFGGINVSAISKVDFLDLPFMFGGEIGPVFSLSYIASNPPEKLILFDPWIQGISRFVPAFLLPEKSFPEYMALHLGGFSDPAAEHAGIAEPQHAELLLQFGWIGLPFLAFFYYCIAGYTVYRLQYLGREARIAGCALVPMIFGFYMQQRGYFFQFLCEYLFTVMPLFFLYYRPGRPKTCGALRNRGTGHFNVTLS